MVPLVKSTKKQLMRKPYLLSTLLWLSVLVSFGQNEWTAEKAMQYKNITGTDISADGKYVAYVVRVPVMEGEKSEYNSQVWVAATDGSFNLQYTRGKSHPRPHNFPQTESRLPSFPTGKAIKTKFI